MSPSVAGRLVDQCPHSTIREKVQVFDWLLKRRDPKTMNNPAGWLVMSIRDDYAAPAGFEPPEQREARAREQRERADAAERKRQAEQQEHDRRVAAVDRWLESLPADERQQLEREAMERPQDFLVRQYHRTDNEQMRQALKQQIIRRHAAERMQKRNLNG